MKKQLFKFGILIGSILSVVFATGGMFGLIDMSWLSPEGIGYTIAVAGAGTVVQETVTTETASDASANLLTNTIDKKITLIRPDLHALDTMTREIGIVVPVQSWETKFYSVDTRGVGDTVKTTQAVGTETEQWKQITFEPTNMHIWNVDDQVLFQGTEDDSTDGFPIVANVVAKSSASGTLSVVVQNGVIDTGETYPCNLPALTAGDKITNIGSAKSEKDAQTTPYAVMPQDTSNYCQIHMAQVEEGLYEKLHSKEVQYNMADFRSAALYDLRRRMELTSLMGFKQKLYDSEDTNWKYTSGGVLRSIPTELEYLSTSIDNDTFIGWAKNTFTGNNGSDTRVILAGSNLMEYMSAIPTIAKQMTAESVKVKWGLTFNEIVTNFGRFMVKHYPTLTDLGQSDNGVVLDMHNIERHVFKKLETRSIDLIGSGQSLADADNISEAFCLVLKNPDTHRRIVKG